MAALPLTLFFDITNRRFVQGLLSTGVFVLPEIQDQDKISIQLQILKLSPNGGIKTPYEVVDPNGYTATVAIVSSALTSTYASVTLSTISGQYLTGLLNCNTVEMAAAIAGKTRLDAVLAIVAVDGTGQVGAQRPIVISYAAIRGGTPAPVENATYLTEAQLRALFMLKIGNAGDTFTLMSPSGIKGTILQTNDDGDFLASPLS